MPGGVYDKFIVTHFNKFYECDALWYIWIANQPIQMHYIWLYPNVVNLPKKILTFDYNYKKCIFLRTAF